LRDGIVDHYAEPGMETNLKRIAAHKYYDTEETCPRPGGPGIWKKAARNERNFAVTRP
jgi:hypothetical protein